MGWGGEKVSKSDVETLAYWHALWKNWDEIRRRRNINIKRFLSRLSFGEKPEDILGQGAVKVTDQDRLEVEALLREGVKIVPIQSPDYPGELRGYPPNGQIYPPLVIYYTGNVGVVDFGKCVAIVGTRNCSLHGRINARLVAKKLVEADITVVTGFARGIDTEATCGALEAGGSVIAVLPWLRPIYPPENERLAQDVKRRGILLCEKVEKPKGRLVKRQIYLRNRIISGLSKAVIVIETGKTGGSFYQVEYALKKGKKVFILKPDKDHKDLVEGYKRFVREGAEPVDDVDGLLDRIRQELLCA